VTARVEHLVKAGQFHLDGGSWEVENNVWLVGDEEEVLVIDAPHDAQAIRAAVGDRRLVAIACTHAHDDHVGAAPALADATGAPILLHRADERVWRLTHAARTPDRWITDGAELTVAGVTLRAVHAPGHTPGSVCFHAPELGVVFSGDTLFSGGPGATGRSFSDRPTILRSIRQRLLTLPPETAVHTGHGPDTTISAEVANVPASDRG
jgi:glyoxylase-like metal-dependent hydrolase (beta-lactamase superfamily II)